MPKESDVLQKWAAGKPPGAAAIRRRLLHLGAEAMALKLPGQPLPGHQGTEAMALKSPRLRPQHEDEDRISSSECAAPTEMQARLQRLQMTGATLTSDESYDFSAPVRKVPLAFPCGSSTLDGGMLQKHK